MARNFNTRASGVTRIMESGKIIERMFFLGRSGTVGDLPHLSADQRKTAVGGPVS